MNIIKSEKTKDTGRAETWLITFDTDITGSDPKDIKKACSSVSWLWDAQIISDTPNTVYYKGYKD